MNDRRDPLAGVTVDTTWDRDPAAHPELAPWRKLAAEWTAQAPLDRIEAKAGFVFGNVALVGTLATGLGLATGARIPDGYDPLAMAAGGLLAVALALALAATLPSWRTSLPLQQPDELRRLYEWRITVRGWLVRLALLAYAAAFVAGVVLAVAAVTATAEPSLALRTVAKGDAVSVTGTVSAKGLDGASTADTSLVAVAVDGATQVLARDISRAGDGGTLTVTLTVDPAPAARAYRLRTAVRDPSGETTTRTLDLPG